jgi:hypothetical protein
MAGSGTRCQRWIAPTTAEYRPGSAIYGTEHCRSKATLVVGSIPVTDGALSILRAGLGNVRESFAILRSASSENDSGRPLSGTGLIEALLSDLRRRQSDSPRTRGPCPTYISRPRMLGATLARPRQETVAVESFSLLALRRTAKLSLTTRTRIGWSLPRPRDLTGVRRVNAKPAPRSDSPLVDYLSRFAQGETGASVGRRPLVGLGGL